MHQSTETKSYRILLLSMFLMKPSHFCIEAYGYSIWSLFCATSVFSSTFSKQKTIPHAVTICIQFSSYPHSTISIQFSSVNSFQFDRQHSFFLSQQFSVRQSAFSFPQSTVFRSTVSIQFFSANSFQFDSQHSVFLSQQFSIRLSAFNFPQ